MSGHPPGLCEDPSCQLCRPSGRRLVEDACWLYERPRVESPDMDQLLTLLARSGGWIEAWYPLSSGTFECRLRFGAGIIHTAWAINDSSVQAFREALVKAEVLVEP